MSTNKNLENLENLVDIAYQLLNHKLQEIVGNIWEKASADRNLTLTEKISVARAYRAWVGGILHDKRFTTKFYFDEDHKYRVLRHDVVVEVLKRIGSTKGNHPLKRLQDDFERIQIPCFDVGVVYLPFEHHTKYNSGDTIIFFEWPTAAGLKYHFGIADASGKARVKEALDTKAYYLILWDEGKRELAKLYNALNLLFVERFSDDYRIYDKSSRTVSAASLLLTQAADRDSQDSIEIEYVLAGEPLLLYHAKTKQLEELTSQNMILGIYPEAYTKRRAKIKLGDILILSSDGLRATFNTRDALSLEQLTMIISDNYDASASTIAEKVQKAIEHKANGSRYDDISLVLIKYTGA